MIVGPMIEGSVSAGASSARLPSYRLSSIAKPMMPWPSPRPTGGSPVFSWPKPTGGQAVAAAALAGALELIATLGGGVVESYPEDTVGRKMSGSFLHDGTLAMFEAAGFVPDRRIGKDRWVVRRLVPIGALVAAAVS